MDAICLLSTEIMEILQRKSRIHIDKSGKQMEVTYDEATRTFTERLESNTMSDEEKEIALVVLVPTKFYVNQ